jgi:hypothetical protein
MKTPILFAAWTAFVIMAVPFESQGRAAGGSVKPNPSASPASRFTAAVRDAVLDSLKQSFRTQNDHEEDIARVKDQKIAKHQKRALEGIKVAIQQAQQTPIGSGPDAITRLLEAERAARAELAHAEWASAPGWREVALDSLDAAIAKTMQALGQ